MDRVVEFATNHWILMLALVAVIVAIVVNETVLLLQGGRSVEPGTATHLYNRENAVFIDLRGENAYHKAHLPGAINIPQERLSTQTKRLNSYKGRPLIVYGEPGRGVGKALAALKAQGLDTVYQLRGGLPGWQEAGLPTEGRG